MLVKTVVYESDNKEALSIPALGLVFQPDKPTPVTDEQAAVLLATYENQYLEGTAEEVAAMKRADGLPYRGTPNPMFGKPKHPEFKLLVEVDAEKAAVPAAPAVPPKPVAPPSIAATSTAPDTKV